MRLDYFLKVSRLVKRRPLAKEMCEKRLVQVNGALAKASKELEPDDTLTLNFRNRTLTVRVEHIPQRAVAKKDASGLYTVLADVWKKEDDLLC